MLFRPFSGVGKYCLINKACFSGMIQDIKYLHYIQGQYVDKKTREYFYFIDHQGMLFLDDARIKNFTSCFKDKKFLAFFFKRVKMNETGRYLEEFPYVSPCGREMNFIRCDDRPIVFTHLLSQDAKDVFCYAHVNELFVDFQPDHIFMDPENGRVYHPGPSKVGGIGLVCSKLAIAFSKDFEFLNGQDSPPTHFTFQGTRHELNQDWFKEQIESST